MLMIDRLSETLAFSENVPSDNDELVREILCWGYDVRRLDEITGHRPLSYVGYLALKKLGCIGRLQLNERKLCNFLSAVERSMPDSNPYHNRVHVSGVVQQMFVQLTSVCIDDPLINCACIIAAVVHDCMHPGMTADAWRALDPTALPKGTSLEQYHLDCALALMTQPPNNFFEAVAPEAKHDLQSMVSELVLATDMTRHAPLMAHIVWSAGEIQSESRPIWLLQLLIKVADLHHCMGSTAAHVGWVQNLFSEIQGRRADEFPPGFGSRQLQFFDQVVLPMVDTLVAIFPVTAPAAQLARANRDCWLD